MSDNRFSIDDILNEHPKRDIRKSDEPFDLDSILAGRGLDKVSSPQREQNDATARPVPKHAEIREQQAEYVKTEAKKEPVIPAEKAVKREPAASVKPAAKKELAASVETAVKKEPTATVKTADRRVSASNKAETPVAKAEKQATKKKEVQTVEQDTPITKKKSFFDAGAINPIEYTESAKKADTYFSHDTSEKATHSPENSFYNRRQNSGDGFGTTLSDGINDNTAGNSGNLSDFFSGSGFETIEEDEGLLAGFKKKLSQISKSKRSRQLEEYTAELPTQNNIFAETKAAFERQPQRQPESMLERRAVKRTEPKPEEASEPIKTIDLREKRVTLEVTGPIITEEPSTKKTKEKTGLFDRPKKNENTGKLSFEGKELKPIQPESATANKEIVENLNRIKKERIQHAEVVPPISRKNISDIDLNLDDKILPNTEPIPIDESASEMQKLRELKERRKKKISDFVLVGDEEDDDESEAAEAALREISDFESFEDAPSVMNDIIQLKSSLVVRFVFLVFATIASGYISLANDFGLPVIEILNKSAQPTTFLFINIILGLLSSFVSYTVISGGLMKLIKLKADCDSISAVAVVATLLSAMVTLAKTNMVSVGLVNVYISAAIASLLFNTIGKLLIVSRTEKNFLYIAGDFERYAIYTIDSEEEAGQFTRGALNDFPVLVSMRKTEFVSDFLKNSYSTDLTDLFCKYAVPSICGVGLLSALLSLIFNKSAEGANMLFVSLSAFAGSISICSCMASMLVVNLPMYKGTKKYINSSAAMLSYQSVEEYSDTNSVLLDVAQLFPEGMISLSAIKIFSDTRIDEAIVEAASLTSHSGSILKHMFYDIIAGKTEMLNPVESYIYEDSMGMCGWINNKRVLLGNRELMVNHSIEGMPTIAREKEYTDNGKMAVYLSISGELSAMFIIEVKASAEVKKWMKEFEKDDICVVLRTVDSIVSINKLAELFEVSPDMLKLIPFRLHPQFEEATSYVPKQSASLACIGRFPSFASLIIGTKRIRKTAHIGMAIQAAAGILGALLALTFVVLSTFSQMTPSLVLGYNFAWAAITAAILGIRKT